MTLRAIGSLYYGSRSAYNLSVLQQVVTFDQTLHPIVITMYPEGPNFNKSGVVIGTANFGGVYGNRAFLIIDLPSRTSLIQANAYSSANRYYFVGNATTLSFTSISSVVTFLEPFVNPAFAYSAAGNSVNYYIGQQMWMSWTASPSVSEYQLWLSPITSNATRYTLVSSTTATNAYATLTDAIPSSVDGTAYTLFIGSPNQDVAPVASRLVYVFPASSYAGNNGRTSFWGGFFNLGAQYRISQSFARYQINSIINGSITMDLMSTVYPGAAPVTLSSSDRINVIGATRTLTNVNLPPGFLMASRFGVPEPWLWGSTYYFRIYNPSNPSQDFNSSTFVLFNGPSK